MMPVVDIDDMMTRSLIQRECRYVDRILLYGVLRSFGVCVAATTVSYSSAPGIGQRLPVDYCCVVSRPIMKGPDIN